MRLLNTSTCLFEEFIGTDIPAYVSLSHTWGEEEVTFKDTTTDKAEKPSSFYRKKSFGGVQTWAYSRGKLQPKIRIMKLLLAPLFLQSGVATSDFAAIDAIRQTISSSQIKVSNFTRDCHWSHRSSSNARFPTRFPRLWDRWRRLSPHPAEETLRFAISTKKIRVP